jgi:hypothetical protein
MTDMVHSAKAFTDVGGHDGDALGGVDLPAGGIFARYYALVV